MKSIKRKSSVRIKQKAIDTRTAGCNKTKEPPCNVHASSVKRTEEEGKREMNKLISDFMEGICSIEAGHVEERRLRTMETDRKEMEEKEQERKKEMQEECKKGIGE